MAPAEVEYFSSIVSDFENIIFPIIHPFDRHPPYGTTGFHALVGFVGDGYELHPPRPGPLCHFVIFSVHIL